MKKMKIYLFSLSILLNAFYWSGESIAQEKKKTDKSQQGVETEYPVEISRFENRHLDHGDKYFKNGEYKKAYNEYFVSVRLNPSFWQGFKGIGDVFIAQGKITAGLNEYLKALKVLNPTYAAKTLDEGEIAMKEGDYGLAIKKFRKIFTISPEAGALLNEGVDLLKEDKKSQAQKKFEEAIKVQNEAIKKYPDKFTRYADAHFKLASFLYEKKKYPEALKEYQNAVSEEKNEFGYFYGLGNAAYKMAFKNKNKIDRQMLEKAVDNLSIALNINHRDYETMFNLAAAKVDLGLQLAQEIQIIQDKNPDKSTNDLNRQVKDLSVSAVKLLEIYSSIYPKDVSARVYLGDAYTMAGELPIRYVRAVEEYKTALNIDSSLIDLYFKQGVSYYLASNIKPDSHDLPINDRNQKYYVKFGKIFYTGDMLTSSQESFNNYLTANLTGGGKYRKTVNEYLKTIEDRLANLGFRVPDKDKGY